MRKRTTTTKDVSLIHQLHQQGQLRLAPEFQRDAVWPPAAKAYLIDTILQERPMPLFFFQRGRSAQTGKPVYAVVDGQQRLRAILEFLDDRFKLSKSTDKRFSNKRFSALPPKAQDTIRNYDLTVEELSGFTDEQIRDVFVRMNKYVVKLSPQELRHAREEGKFYEFVESLGRLKFWTEYKVFTPTQLKRMRAVEYSAELTILLIEGPQDKKASIDLYYQEYRNRFAEAAEVKRRLTSHLNWVTQALPSLHASRFRKPTDLYGVIGALSSIEHSPNRRALNPKDAGKALRDFEKDLGSKRPSRKATAYLAAASRQTDNIAPRNSRIEILTGVLVNAS